MFLRVTHKFRRNSLWQIYWIVYTDNCTEGYYEILWLLSFYDFYDCRGSRPGVLLGKGILKICCKFIREHPCRSAISIKLFCNFNYSFKLHLGMGVHLQICCIFSGHLYLKNTSAWLLLWLFPERMK